MKVQVRRAFSLKVHVVLVLSLVVTLLLWAGTSMGEEPKRGAPCG